MKTRQNRAYSLAEYCFRRKDECPLLVTNAGRDADSVFPVQQPAPLILAHIEDIKSMRDAQAELITNVTILGKHLNGFCNRRREIVVCDTADSRSERRIERAH